MILNNFKTVELFQRLARTEERYWTNYIGTVKNTSGTKVDNIYSYYHAGCMNINYEDLVDGMKQQTEIVSAMDIVVGNGTTPVTADDFKIESEVFDGLQFVSMTKKGVSGSNGKMWIDYYKTMKNNTGETITISEIGLKNFMYAYQDNKHPILLTREILEQPIVVPNGGIFTVQAGIVWSM